MIVRSLATTLLVAGLAFGQPPTKKETPKTPSKPAPGSLEDTLEKVLRHSADIKAAEAKVREAEAQLNLVRQQVLTRTTALHGELNLAKRMLSVAQDTLAQKTDMVRKGIAPAEGLPAAQLLVEKHRGDVEKLETELRSLRGEFALKGLGSAAFSSNGAALYTMLGDGTVRIMDANTGKFVGDLFTSTGYTRLSPYGIATEVKTPMADRVRNLLDQEVEFEAKHISIADAFKWLLDAAKTDISYRDLAKSGDEGTITLMGKMPIGAWFQALEDSDPNVCIVVRDYGLLMTRKDRAPTSAVGVSELWKSKPKEDKKPAEKK